MLDSHAPWSGVQLTRSPTAVHSAMFLTLVGRTLRIGSNHSLRKWVLTSHGPSKYCSYHNSTSLAELPEINDHHQLFYAQLSDCSQLVQRNSIPVAVFNAYLDQKPISVICIDFLGKECKISASLLSECEKHSINWANDNKSSTDKPLERNLNNIGKPTEDQLNRIYLELSEQLPKFFVQPHNYLIYHDEIEFQNKIRGVTTYGLPSYIQQLSIIKILAHLKYSHIRFEILKITQHPEDGTVRVRWRVIGVPGLRKIFMFWKYKLWEWRKSLMSEDEADWIDGFSIFSVGSDGRVYRHVCDKMMPDEERSGDAKLANGNVAVKLAALLGLTLQKPDGDLLDDLSTFFSLVHINEHVCFQPNG